MLVRSMHGGLCAMGVHRFIPIPLIASLRRRDCPISYFFCFSTDDVWFYHVKNRAHRFHRILARVFIYFTICTLYLSHTSSKLIPRIRFQHFVVGCISCDATNQLMCQGIAQYDRNTFPPDPPHARIACASMLFRATTNNRKVIKTIK